MVLRAARRADAQQAGLLDPRARAADAAVGMAAVPVEQRRGVGDEAAVVLVEERGGVAQPGRGGAVQRGGSGAGGVEREQRAAAVLEPEQHRLARAVERHQRRAAVGAQVDAVGGDHQRAALGRRPEGGHAVASRRRAPARSRPAPVNVLRSAIHPTR